MASQSFGGAPARNASTNWVQNAGIKKGGLHKSLGVPAGKTIPKAEVAAAAQKGGLIGKQARLAQTFAKMGK